MQTYARLTMSLHSDKLSPMNIRKEQFLQIRITPEEKEKIKQKAKKNGFDSLSAYILWLCRKSGK